MTAKILTLFAVILCVHLNAFAQDAGAKMLSIGLNAPGEVLITSPDGRRIGYDAVAKKTYDEIKGGGVSTARDREPVYRVPVGSATQNLTIRVFGKTKLTKGDLGISGDGFTLRAIGLALEPRRIFDIVLRPDLSEIRLSGNAIIENPTINLAVDPPLADQPSYIFKLARSKLLPKKLIRISLNLTARILNFGDNGTPKSTYSLQATRIDAAGGEQNYAAPKIVSTKSNQFQFDFKKWIEKADGCLKIDENANGFDDEKCEN